MDPIAFVPYLGLFGGLAAAVYAALRFNREDAGQVVEQQSTVVGDMEKLNVHLREEIDRLQMMLDKVRTRRDELETALAAERDQGEERKATIRQLEENLRLSILEQQRLERRLIELGEDPGHAEV